MATNLGDIGLGDILLGEGGDLGVSSDLFRMSTLAFTHDVSLAGSTFERSASSTIVFSHATAVHKVSERTATSTLNLTQVLTNQSGYFANNTFAPISTATYDAVFWKFVTQSLTLTQARSETEVRVRSASSTLAFSQSIVRQIGKALSNTLVFTQDATAELTRVAIDTLALTHDVDVTTAKVRSVFANFTPTHAVSREMVYDRSLTNTLTLTQTAQRAFEESADNTLTLTHTVLHSNAKFLTQSLALAHTVEYDKVFTRSIAHTISFEHEVDFTRVINIAAPPSLLILRHGGRFRPLRFRTAFNTLTFLQDLVKSRFTQSESSILAFAQTLELTHVKNISVSNRINLSQLPERQNTYGRSVSNNLVFLPERRQEIRIGELLVVVTPTVTGTVISRTVKKRNLMLLEVAGVSVVLPAPQFGDREGLMDAFNMNISMTGEIYTTIKRTGTKALSYEWDLSYRKAEELAGFIWENNAKAIKVTTWEGEVWLARMVGNPVELRDMLRVGDCDSKVFVQLDFEGVRIH